MTKSDGCTFFDAERGFIFDMDGDWIMEGPLGPMRNPKSISAEEAYEIVNNDDYCLLFFGEKMREKDIEHAERYGLAYRLRR